MDRHPSSVRLSLELRPAGAALTGTLHDERGDEHAFNGWLPLLTLLEAARVRVEPETIAA